MYFIFRNVFFNFLIVSFFEDEEGKNEECERVSNCSPSARSGSWSSQSSSNRSWSRESLSSEASSHGPSTESSSRYELASGYCSPQKSSFVSRSSSPLSSRSLKSLVSSCHLSPEGRFWGDESKAPEEADEVRFQLFLCLVPVYTVMKCDKNQGIYPFCLSL